MLKIVLLVALLFSVGFTADKKSTVFKSKTGYSIDLEDCWTPEVQLHSNSEKVEESYWLDLERKKKCSAIMFESQIIDFYAASVIKIDKNFWPTKYSKYEYGRTQETFYFEYKSEKVKIPYNLKIIHTDIVTRWEYGIFCRDIFVLLSFGFNRPMKDPKEVAKLKMGSSAIPAELKKLIDSIECTSSK